MIVADGVDASVLQPIYDALTDQGAIATYVGHRLGAVQSASGEAIEVEITMETAPAVLFDALVLPGGDTAIETLLERACDGVRKTPVRHANPFWP